MVKNMKGKYMNVSKSAILWIYIFVCGIIVLNRIFRNEEIISPILVLIYALCYTLLPFGNSKMLKYISKVRKKYLFIKFLISTSFFFLILEIIKNPKMLGYKLDEIVFLVITIMFIFIYLLLWIDEKLLQLGKEVVR